MKERNMTKEEFEDLYCTNKEDILNYLNMNSDFGSHMKSVIKIVEKLDLPDLKKLFDYENYQDEALVYNMIDEQEQILPITGVSIDRIYDIKITDMGWSHATAYSIPVVVVPFDVYPIDINKETINDIDNKNLGLDEVGNALNYFYGFGNKQ